jgi:hypothetical protein
MLHVIRFDIHNYADNATEEFIIENTIENEELVFTHRYTRNIRFDKMLDFQFEKEMRTPVEFIDARVWLALLPLMENATTELIEETSEVPSEIIKEIEERVTYSIYQKFSRTRKFLDTVIGEESAKGRIEFLKGKSPRKNYYYEMSS